MNFKILVPVGLGVISVIQAGLNRKVALKFDLSSAALLNNAVLFVLSFAVFFIFSKNRDGGLGASTFYSSLQFWNLLPGILGICLVAGIPWAIAKWGASTVFISLITSQILTSIIWDTLAENRPLEKPEILGAAFSVLGVIFLNMKG